MPLRAAKPAAVQHLEVAQIVVVFQQLEVGACEREFHDCVFRNTPLHVEGGQLPGLRVEHVGGFEPFGRTVVAVLLDLHGRQKPRPYVEPRAHAHEPVVLRIEAFVGDVVALPELREADGIDRTRFGVHDGGVERVHVGGDARTYRAFRLSGHHVAPTAVVGLLHVVADGRRAEQCFVDLLLVEVGEHGLEIVFEVPRLELVEAAAPDREPVVPLLEHDLQSLLHHEHVVGDVAPFLVGDGAPCIAEPLVFHVELAVGGAEAVADALDRERQKLQRIADLQQGAPLLEGDGIPVPHVGRHGVLHGSRRHVLVLHEAERPVLQAARRCVLPPLLQQVAQDERPVELQVVEIGYDGGSLAQHPVEPFRKRVEYPNVFRAQLDRGGRPHLGVLLPFEHGCLEVAGEPPRFLCSFHI